MVRCTQKYDKENDIIKTASRGGGDYDIPTTLIRQDEQLLEFFRENPDIILDGELYVHGWTLQKISGTCRKKEWVESRHAPLEYWVFDIVDPSMNFNERLDILTDMHLDFGENEKVIILEHVLVEGWSSVKRLHDKYVAEGFEGVVLRKPNKKYSPGSKNSDWVKVKDYMDDEFEIIGIEEKLRDEDMVFTMKTKAGQKFNAKPVGNREIKKDYLENWPELVGKMATVTYFSLHEGIPQQPVFKSIREEGE